MKTTKKLLALLLALVMLMSVIPMGAFAVGADETVETTAATEADSSPDETTEVTEEPEATTEPTAEATTEATEEPTEETTDPTETTEIALFADEPAEDEGRGVEYVSPRDTSGDPLYKILHIDAGRKYTSLATLKTMVDYVAINGMNQIDLYLSDNQGLRFGVTDSEGNFIISANGTTYNLANALGYYDNSAAEPSKATDKIDKWLSPAEMKDLIIYAAAKGVDIVPSINMPGHMAAILQGSGDARISAFGKTFYSQSESTHYSNESLDMGNKAAVNFALALLDAYCSYFRGITDDEGNRLVKYFSIAADEYGQDLEHFAWGGEGFGTAYMNAKGEYGDLVQFLNRAGNVIKSYGMTPRAFNDAFLSDYNTDAKALGLNTDYQLYYWGGGWGGMKNADPDVLSSNGFKVINCNSNYYYICCHARPYGSYYDTVEAIRNNPFELKTFATGTVSFTPAGAMYCIWCDHCTGGASHETDISTSAMEVMAEWAACLSATPDVNYEYVEKVDDTGVKIGAAGLSDIAVDKLDDPTILAAAEGKVLTYSVQMLNAQRDYTGSYRISLPIPDGWDAAKVRGFTVGELAATMSADNEATLPVREASGNVKDGYYVLDVDTPYAAVGIYEAADAPEGQEVVNITLNVGDTYDLGTLEGDFRDTAHGYDSVVEVEQTADFVPEVPGTPEIPGTPAEDAVPPTKIDMSDFVSGGTYLIGDGNGNYMTFLYGSCSNTKDYLDAIQWTVTRNSDGTYSFSTTNGYLKFKEWNSPSISTEAGDGTYFTRTDDGFTAYAKNWNNEEIPYTLKFAGSNWNFANSNTSGTPAVLFTPGKAAIPAGPSTPAVPGTPAKTSLKLVATGAGTTSVTIGNTTYNVTVIANVSDGYCEEHDITASGHGVNGLICEENTSVTSINGYENIGDVKITGYSLTPTVDDAVYKGEVQVKMPVPADWTDQGGIIQAFLKQNNGTAVAIPVTIEGDYATYTVPGGTVSGLFKLPAGYYTKEVNILMGNNSTVTRIQQGAYTTKDVYYCDNKNLVSVTAEVTSPYIPAVPAGVVSAIEVGKDYYITDGNGNYLTVVNGRMENTTDPDKAAKWNCHSTDSGTYRLISGGYNLNNTGSGFFISTDGGASWWSPYVDPELGLYKNGQYLVFKDGAWTTSTDSTGHSIVYGTGSDAVPAKSTVTITSHDQTGTTSVIVGTVKYNITIADKSLVDNKVRIHSMITNDLVLIGGSDASPVCHVDVNAAMPGVNTEEGIDITKLFPTNAVRKEDKMVFWKMTWLPYGNHQGTETGSPYLVGEYEGGIAGQVGTMTGYENRVDFTRLRYYEGKWEFYLDAELDAWNTTQKWGEDTNGDGTITADEFEGWYPVDPTDADLSVMPGVDAGKGQIVAYYLQVTDVTREVITNVADWGPAIDDSRNVGYGANYVLLDFAVRYEDGVRNPDEIGTFPYSEGSYNSNGVKYTTDKTMGFHCTEGWGDVEKRDDGTLWRKINTIMATTDKIDDYEIYMITTTESGESKQLSTVDMSQNKRSSDGTGGYDYDTKTETVVWLKDENVRYNTEEIQLGDNVAYGYRENGTHTSGVPMVNSITIQNEHAVLVTYYVRYVGNTSDDLRVHYINRTLNDIEFYNYSIHVKAGTLFDETFARTDNEYGLTGNTVINYYDVIQTVQGDPRSILDVSSFYRSTKLTLVEVRRSDDGKDLYLYYDTNNAKDMVVDFGLPVEITKDSLQLTLDSDEVVSFIGAIDGTNSELVKGQYYVQKGDYGYFFTNLTDNGRCYYIPTDVMRGTESMRMAVTTNKTTTTNPHRYVMSVFPATTVYYEEYFAKYEGTWTGNTEKPAMSVDYVSQYIGNQQSAYPGMTDAYNYGYDGIYDTAAKTQAVTTTPGSRATFEFTGNGFEVYADCTTSTGTVMVALYKVDGQTEKMKSVYMVDTVRKDGDSTLTTYEGESQNTPIVSVRDLAYGDYKVVMILTNYTNTAKFVFDGFRVFNTMDSAIDEKVYDKDAESRPEFVEVRDCVLFAKLPNKDAIDESSVYINQIAEGVSSQVYTLKGDQKVVAVLMAEGDKAVTEANVMDYLDNGTKNEVYVRPGQSLVITLPSEDVAAKTQIGMKTLTGTTTYGNKTISQTNMYYEGMNNGATITISNPSGAPIISITDLKIPGGIPADSTADTQSLQSGVQQALLWMGYKEEPKPTEPEVTEPEVTEPKTTEPAPTEPKVTEPKPTEPALTEPKVTEPKPTEPTPTEPKATEPKPTESVSTEPQVTEPKPTEPEVTEPKPTEPGNGNPGDTYVSGKAYHRGDTVVFNGKTYRAKWWTRGENPETSQVWELVDDGNQTAAPAFWSPFKIYTAGMQVTYKGHVYEAKWWTIGLAPGKGWWSAWKQIS